MADEPELTHEQRACRHEQFEADVQVARLEDSGRFMADVRIWCVDCGAPMVFLGLPRGIDMNGAAVSTFGEELRAAIHPKGETVPETAMGFEQRKREEPDDAE